MHKSTGWKFAVSTMTAMLGVGLLCVKAVLIGCAPTPFLINGPGFTNNRPPTLEFILPVDHFTRGQGDPFVIRWTDSDQDDVALVGFSLVSTKDNSVIPLVAGIEEDPTSIGFFSAATKLIPPSTYNILATIDDGINSPVAVFAMTANNASPQRIIATIVGEGEGPQTEPPSIVVTEPGFNLSVSQDDLLRVVVQPSDFFDQDADNNPPFDPDSIVSLFIVLDIDTDPTNDDPSDANSPGIILLDQALIQPDDFEPKEFNIQIDLAKVPPRPAGEPYFIRATADDGTNPRVHQYAVGTINVVQLAAGLVDLNDIGLTKAGATFYGFNPKANVGSTISSVSDFDVDGVDDFAIVAQFGNPRNLGPVGEAYLIYGRDNVRFGGKIGVNSISGTVSGVIFEAPPIRENQIGSANPRTDGITDISFVEDLTNDGRPDILMGLSHVHGAFEATDFDPSDDEIGTDDDTENITVVMRQGFVEVTEAQQEPEITSFIYTGFEETTIHFLSPTTNFGSSATIGWQDDGAGQKIWTLLKIKDILKELPDTAENIEVDSVRATLEMRIFRTGGDAILHLSNTDFNEQTTFNTYAAEGGEPTPDVDYEITDNGGGIATISGGSVETVTVDISDEFKLLLDREFQNVDNELRFIMVPNLDANEATQLRSSEESIELNRPTLRITYPRLNRSGAQGCYPDDIVNNVSDSDTQDPNDVQWMAGGMALFINSDNRDNDPPATTQTIRLETTSIALELVGQESGPNGGGWALDDRSAGVDGNIFVRADDTNEENRIAGARFVAGHYDFEDANQLSQGPREGLFGKNVASIGDLNNDGLNEIIISAPRNELYLNELLSKFGPQSTHLVSSIFRGSLLVLPGNNYSAGRWRDINSDTNGSNNIPFLDQQIHRPFGSCTTPRITRHFDAPRDTFEVFAEEIEDMLGDGQSAGDFNQDGLDDILCGAYLNNRIGVTDSGAVYILYGRNVPGSFELAKADASDRAPMLRIRGLKNGDQIGWAQDTGQDVNGDRISDVFISSPRADYGGVGRNACAGDFNGDGSVNSADLNRISFNNCLLEFNSNSLFSDDSCKAFDYDNDNDVDSDDKCVFCCLSDSCVPDNDCIFGKNENACCENVVDNGFAAVIYGGVFTDGDRDISSIGTTDLPGAIFYGGHAGDRAGIDISSAGDFNQDGFGDILISVPGEVRCDREIPQGRSCSTVGRERLGVVYLVFGGVHLFENMPDNGWNLSDPNIGVGTPDLPGIVFVSPFVKGRPNEAAPTTVAFIGDINNDGFGDIAIGNPHADFIDQSFPQGPNAPGSDAAVGRRRDAGHTYIIYGNNFGTNRQTPP